MAVANYPQAAAAAPEELPERYEYQGQDKRLVWRENTAVHGFLSRWEKSSVLTDKLRSWAEGGNRRSARDAELFAPMVRSGRDLAMLRVFVAEGVERSIETGAMIITFADRSSVTDEGVFLYGPIGSGDRPQSSLSRVVHLSSGKDPEMTGMAMYFFVPAGHLQKRIAKVELRTSE